MANVFETEQHAREYLDPHNERVWEDPSDDTSIVRFSQRYKEGAAPTRDV
jgi:hypothetical protein